MSEDKRNRTETQKPVIEEDEIDLVEVAKTIWARRKLIIKVTIIFFIIGLIVAFGSKVEYEASTKLLPDSQEGMSPNLGGLGGIAGLAGINLDMMRKQGVISPNLYPQIVQSLPFQLDIINQNVRFDKKDTITTSYEYFKEIDNPSVISLLIGYTVGLPFKLKKLIFEGNETEKIRQKEGDIIELSKEQFEIIEQFKERITVLVDDESGMITLTTQMPDAYAAAQLANISVKKLQDRITEYKINKARHNLEFVRERFQEAKAKFQQAQERLAAFDDRHRNVVTAMAQTQQQRLQNEYDVAFEVYKSLASQLEQAEIKVKEETPVFTVVEPVNVPVEKSKPKRVLILLVFLFVGLISALAIIFINQILSSKINGK